MERETVKVTLFGNFSLTSGQTVLKEKDIYANKMVQILVYIIVNRDTPVMSRRLNEEFWAGNSRNPESALKNLMYRLRSRLKELGIEEYICTQPGGYQWNPEILVETDYEQFEKLREDLEKQTDNSVRKELCRKMIDSYHGNISARLVYESWLQPQILKYQTMYLEAAKILSSIYEQEGDWRELELLCRKIVAQEPLDEDIQYWLIRSLQKQQKYDQAMHQYEEAKRRFYKDLGIKTLEKLQGIFQDAAADNRIQTADIADIVCEASEKEEPRGAFFCDYQIFRQIYRLEMRRIDRAGISEYILLLTVRRAGKIQPEGKVKADSGLLEGAGILEQVAKETLRIGDVVTRSGALQYVILLSACSYEAGLAVAERIKKKFLRKIRYRKLELQYELRDLSLQWQEAMGK